MLRMFVIALALAILGDWLAVAADLPIPGSTIGMVILALAFSLRGGADEHAARLFEFASPHFPLFFVPAAVGVVGAGELLATAWLSIAVAIVLGTAATIAGTGLIAQALLNRFPEVRTA